MLPRKLTLTKAEIETVAKKGRYIGRNEYLSIKYLDRRAVVSGADGEVRKFAISVSKKVEKLAVKRNSIKRRLRVAVDGMLTGDKIEKIAEGYYLIVVQAPLPRVSAAAVTEDLMRIVQKRG